MEITIIEGAFTVSKLKDNEEIPLKAEYCFFSKTKEENSLVCQTKDVPTNTIAREDGWRGLFITQAMEFSLVGILSKITTSLSRNKIPVFAVSTYNTDYIFVKEENFTKAVKLIEEI